MTNNQFIEKSKFSHVKNGRGQPGNFYSWATIISNYPKNNLEPALYCAQPTRLQFLDMSWP